jgi:hypothetical protein
MFCAAPFKLTTQIDLIPPLQEYLKKSYSKDVAAKQMKSCEFVNQTRNKAVAGLVRPDTAREVCTRWAVINHISFASSDD